MGNISNSSEIEGEGIHSPLVTGMLRAQRETQKLKDPESAKQMNVSETCECLEAGKLPIKWIDQARLYQCVMHWESCGYTENMIANILGRSPRTIRRYAKDIKEVDISNDGGNFKIKFLNSLVRRWNARTAYFIHLANDKTATLEVRLQAMKAAQEVDRDLVNVVAKFVKI